MIGAKRRHSFPCPAIPMPSQQATPVKRTGQQIIRTDARQHANRPDNNSTQRMGTRSHTHSRISWPAKAFLQVPNVSASTVRSV